MASKGVVVFRGDSGAPENHYSKAQISDVTDDTALATLATSLAALSDANVAKRSFVELTIVTDAAPGADANVDKKAVAYFRDPTTLHVHSVTIPAIKDTAWENTNEGDRLTAASMTAIVSAINTATGKSYTSLYGVVYQVR
jgi:hypothetical protein